MGRSRRARACRPSTVWQRYSFFKAGWKDTANEIGSFGYLSLMALRYAFTF